MWLKNKVLGYRKIFGDKGVTVKRDYFKNRIIIDFNEGWCAKYSYSGEWIVG
tara:strand:- start:2264 stop:2419 length:156 start_codon:yes stop_codon:yes gene_type:complete